MPDVNNEPYLLSWNGGATRCGEVQDSREDGPHFSTNIYSDFTQNTGDHYFKVMGGFNAELYRSSGLTVSVPDLISQVPSLGD